MTDDELLIISPLDQSIEVEDEDQVLDKIRKLIAKSIEEKNARKAIHICYQIVKILKLGGLALAESLYMIFSHWEELGINDTFEDTITSRTGLHRATVQRYISVWSMYAENKIPEIYIDQIKQMNIKSQIPIAQALSAGYEIKDGEWKELSEAYDFSTINAKLRDIKGKEPRSHALVMIMDREGGIKAIKGEKQVYVGWLNLDDEDEIVQQSISRIEKGAGILRQ